MKTMNNTCVEVLPALLNKTKIQSIRYHNKQKYKVGDKVQQLWDLDSKYDVFCQYCGDGQTIKMKAGVEICCEKRKYHPWTKETFGTMSKSSAHGWLADTKYFNKNLGTVEITEVDNIELSYDKEADNMFGGFEAFAKLDGFSSAKKFFSYFDKTYDLSKPKEFHVYRFRWL